MLHFDEFEKLVYANAITIETISKLKKGDTLDLLVFDRNVCDIAFDNNEEGKAVNPQEFFRENKMVYTHDANLKGIMSWPYGIYNKEFEIEYIEDRWFPLINGCLPPTDPKSYNNPQGSTHTVPKPWQEFPVTTRVGWRGPMVIFSKLKDLPKVYWGDKLNFN